MWLSLPAECSNERLLQQKKHPQERTFRLTGANLRLFRGAVRKPYVNPTMIFLLFCYFAILLIRCAGILRIGHFKNTHIDQWQDMSFFVN